MYRKQLYSRVQLMAAALLVVACGGRVAADQQASPPAPLEKFANAYCLDCHGPMSDGPEGDFSLADILGRTTEDGAAESWQKALDAIESHDMPPDYMEQPTEEERTAAIAAIHEILASDGTSGRPGRAQPRRLTRLEYNNTVRDLLGLRTDVFLFSERLPFDKSYFDPANGKLPETLKMSGREYGAKYPVLLPDSGLPPDSRAEHGFSNRGDAQNLSAGVLEQYIRLASEIAFHPDLLEAAERANELFPNAKDQSASLAEKKREADRPARRQIATAINLVGPNANVQRSATESSTSLQAFNERLQLAFEADRGGVESFESVAGSTILAESGNLQVAYGHNANRVVALVPDIELWAVGFSSAEETSGGTLLTNKQQNVKRFEIAFRRPGEDRWKGPVEVGLVLLSRKGQAGTVVLTAQLSDGNEQVISLDLAEGAGSDNVFVSFQSPQAAGIQSIQFDGSGYEGPYLLLDDLAFVVDDEPGATPEVSGRELPESPNLEPLMESRREVTSRDGIDYAALSPRERLSRFMRRAFRRPVGSDEVDRYFAFYEAAIQEGADEELAMRAALQGVLSSPHFLYLIHVGNEASAVDDNVRRLTDHELASRLSYFLWSSMPDDELLDLADSGRLSDPDVLDEQVHRMLQDKKVRELSESFFVEWLRLRELWSSQPNERQFREFYTGPMGKRTSARDLFGEALLMFEAVLVEDRQVLELLHADYTYVNSRVAKLYDLKANDLTLHESGEELSEKSLASDETWHRVRLPDARRGGVMTMGATLTLTSFPERTSPIKRGAWFLETIFNRPPPPPTVAVPDIDEQDTKGQELTLREKVEMHRADAACAVCHNRIDPPGFALENFDAIGRWRERDGSEVVDPSGKIPGLGEFAGPTEFKQLLLQNRDRFLRGFTEHLLSYALSRKLEHFDIATVEAIQQEVTEHDYRLRSMIEAIVQSDAFQFTERP